MNLLDYIKGERRGKEAHQLEQESMHDSFLSDAIDGYDWMSDNPAYYLKTLRKQINMRSKKKSHLIQLWSAVVCVMGIIFLSIIFFLQEPNRIEEPSIYVENQNEKPPVDEDTTTNEDIPVANETVIEEIIANYADIPKREIAETKAIPQKEESYLSQREEIQTYFEEENGKSTLTNAELQSIFSEKPQEAVGEKTDGPILQTPKPVIGENAYKEYIEKNRHLPQGSACESKQGSVILLFHINEKGRPVKITILRSLCRTADNEAIRLLQNGPNWTVGENNARLEIPF